MANLTVLKFGGELLEDSDAIRSAARAIVRMAACTRILVVHGGGRAIDAELRNRGLEPRFVDGLRLTDAAALDVAVSVLAGAVNTRLVAAIGAAGGRAIGLTGADGLIGLSERMPPFRSASGSFVDCGFVGSPAGEDPRLLIDLLTAGYVPVVCSIGVDGAGALLNINADTFAAHLALALHANTLVIAGTTAGVLDENGTRIPELSPGEIFSITSSGIAHSGMVAKLSACRDAILGGVENVMVVNGRATTDLVNADGTRIVIGSVVAPGVERNA